jgi:type 1 glutamine amidotransferase
MLRVCRVVLVALLSAAMALTVTPPATAGEAAKLQVLVFTKATEREQAHRATSDAVGLLEMTGRRYGITFDHTDDAEAFTGKRLAGYDVVMWLNTYGDVLDEPQQRAFQTWMSAGGGFVGVHGAARSEPRWDYFHDLVGAYETEGEGAPAIEKEISFDTTQQSVKNMPPTWADHSDQWYHFDRDPAELSGMNVLATVPGEANAPDQPVAWCRTYEGGRSWYTSLGHPVKAFEDGDYMKLLRGGIWWAAEQKGQPLVRATDAAPPWPYGLSFLAWIAAVAFGGALAVVKLNRYESVG